MLALLTRYSQRMCAAGVAERSALNRLKQWLCYGAGAEPTLRGPFDAIKRCASLHEALTALEAETTGRSAEARSTVGARPQPRTFLAASRTCTE